MDLRIVTTAKRPELSSTFPETDPWPPFMDHDPIGLLYYSDNRVAHPEFGLIGYDAADPDHPAHEYFLDRSARLRESIADSFGAEERRSALDPDTLARVIQAASDGLQLQWMIDPSVDMPGIMSALIDALHPPVPPTDD